MLAGGNHFDVAEALHEPAYCAGRRSVLDRHGLAVWAIGNHLVGQAVCDPIDERHRAVLPEAVWGDGDPEGVRRRAAEHMKDTARAAAQLGVEVVTGFTGSPVWHLLYSFPPNDFAVIDQGYEEFAERWGPIIDVFEAEGVRFALEVHPTEIAYDFVTTRRALDAIGDRPGFGINFDPSHFEHQFLDSAASSSSSLTRSSTRTSRTPSGCSTDVRRSSEGTSTSASPAAVGTSSPQATATSTSRRCSGR